MVRWLAPLVLLALGVLPCRAHLVPKDNHDRTILVRLEPEGVVVDYRLEVDELRAAEDMPRNLLVGLSNRRDLAAAYARYQAPILAGNLDARLDGGELEFRCQSQHSEILDHVRCDFRFFAPWKLGPEGSHSFQFREGNYELDSISAIRLSLTVSPLLTGEKVVMPDQELIDRPLDARKPGDGERLRRASVVVRATPTTLPGSAKPALPPTLDLPRPPAGRGKGVVISSYKEGGHPAVCTRTAPVDEAANNEQPQDDRLLTRLLDSRQGLGMLLLLAALFGAAHALTPGHGKTLVAAYLVGERGTVAHALVLGLATTLSHTWVVFLLAILMSLFPISAGAAQVLLGLVGGLLVAGLGLWLLLQRLTGQPDHVHLPGGHSHGHGEGHSHSHAEEAHHSHGHTHGTEALPVEPGWWGVILLGIAGGIVPCWDALVLLWCVLASQRPWLGPPLVLAFSAGLASVLVILGVGVVHARKFASNRWGNLERFQGIVRLLPLFSAAIITVLGLWMCFSTMAGLH
jgi:ABC-type nickel/cobalt efflux system permease component RcnA